MNGGMVFVLFVAAFCVGVLADRGYDYWQNSERLAAINGAVPMPSAEASIQSGALTMQTCMASANRRGMTREQANHACAQIVY